MNDTPIKIDAIHNYWRSPGEENAPHTYARPAIGRSLFLVDRMREAVDPSARILELGCNVGRNLAFLHHAGFKRLSGVEINAEAIALGRELFPELKSARIIHGTIEDTVQGLADDSHDLIYTMAVLEHLHTDSEWVFEQMTRIAPRILTIEDEATRSPRHFPRRYDTVFVALGYIETAYADRVPGLPKPFRCRLFQRP
ncbi:class I SAM-dependent methyltransferase [uncultured Sulfitobacter sp.]|uniref:class I SAM-dependent methyltransferase n=1 Tax=uncultured Sulfitobacter sp. TaxID=191468 RepID=UPI002615B6F2|nr:class I SAM-dependent methyltransferase [uncultured Sulfitobacter sp.]